MKLVSNARLAGYLTLLATLTTAAPAHAGIIVGTITGQVTAVGDSVKTINVGGPIVGSYSYDDSVVSATLFGDLINPFVTFSLSIGSEPFTLGLADLVLPFSGPFGRRIAGSTDDVDMLYFLVNYAKASELVGGPVNSMGISWSTPQSFSVNNNGVYPEYSLAFSFTATPTGSAAVPEPAGIAMLAVGALVVGFAARQRGR